jgi:hypothetical protein
MIVHLLKTYFPTEYGEGTKDDIKRIFLVSFPFYVTIL